MTLPAAAARAPAASDRYLLPAPRLRQAADVLVEVVGRLTGFLFSLGRDD